MNYSKALNECIESAYMVAGHFGARYLESWHLLIAMSNHREFYDGAKALAEDEVSELVKSDYGYHIIKRVKLDDSQLDNYKNDIVSAISGSMDELLQQWMDEAQVETTDLYSTITYENVYDYLPQDVQSLVTRPGSDAAQTTDEQSATEQSDAQ